MEKTKIIYDKSELKDKIKSILAQPGERFAIVAYLGKNAIKNYYPPKNKDRQGIKLVINAESTGTNPHEIKTLLKEKVEFESCLSLHAKVFWAKGYGALIGSSNLSTNGFDVESEQIEAGVFIENPDYDKLDEFYQSLAKKSAKDIEKILDTLISRYERKKQSLKYIKAAEVPEPELTMELLNQQHKKQKLFFVDFKSKISSHTKEADILAKLSDSDDWFEHPSLFDKGNYKTLRLQRLAPAEGDTIIFKYKGCKLKACSVIKTENIEGSKKTYNTLLFLTKSMTLEKSVQKKLDGAWKDLTKNVDSKNHTVYEDVDKKPESKYYHAKIFMPFLNKKGR